MENHFKNTRALAQRTIEAQRMLFRYPYRLPVIIECGDPKMEALKNVEYLVPKELTIGQLLYVIRRRVKLESTQSIFLFIRNTLPPVSHTLSDVYQMYRDVDGFLYCQYRSENTFG